jgi:tRNA 5-methylaminomethyl-2-thiouridine biosynthesis bifunctional protein
MPSGACGRHWQVLDTHFDTTGPAGSGLQRLADAWQTWQNHPQQPERLFYTALLAGPLDAEFLSAGTVAWPADLAWLTHPLKAQCTGMLPGVHRFRFANDQLHITLCIGSRLEHLAGLDTALNQIFWSAPDSRTDEPDFQEHAPKQLARLSQPGTLILVQHAPAEKRARLATAGYQTIEGGLPWEARYDPHWPVRSNLRRPSWHAQQRVLVVGGGLSGSAVAYSLAQRGCAVEVLDADAQPAAGASGLPVGLVAPHVSPDDSALSRITRAGVATALPRLAQLLQPGRDWAPSGVLEHRIEGKRGLPSNALWTAPDGPGSAWSRTANTLHKSAAQLPDNAEALWHDRAAWLRPRALVQAQLAHRGVVWRGHTRIETLQRTANGWQVDGTCGPGAEPFQAETDTLVLCTAFDTLRLLSSIGHRLPLNALRGQVTWGRESDLPIEAQRMLPPFPVNGHGSFIHGMDFDPTHTTNTPCWVVGSTFERGATTAQIEPGDQIANRERLARLLPHVFNAGEAGWASAQAWAGVRCTLPDRLPAVGSVGPQTAPGLLVCAGMGARGLTLSVLCGELLAAELFGEPWPLERKLALALLASRFQAKNV